MGPEPWRRTRRGRGVLEGKVALVAGATRGAGRAIAVELARAGAWVYATGRSSRTAGRSEIDRPETIEKTGELITAAGGGLEIESARWTGKGVSSGYLAPLYGFTDTDGTRPDCRRYVVEVQDRA